MLVNNVYFKQFEKRSYICIKHFKESNIITRIITNCKQIQNGK